MRPTPTIHEDNPEVRGVFGVDFDDKITAATQDRLVFLIEVKSTSRKKLEQHGEEEILEHYKNKKGYYS